MNWLVVAGVLTVAYGVAIELTLGWERTRSFLMGETKLNEVGDFLAGVFAPIALIWLVAAVLTQRQELNETRSQFETSQSVIDAQLSVINRQNSLLAEQHNQAVENAKKAYRLTLFDKRFQIYQRFISLGNQFETETDFDWESARAVLDLSHEATFVFDGELAKWLADIADNIEDYLHTRRTSPWEYGDDGAGNISLLPSSQNTELERKFYSWRDNILEVFHPHDRMERFFRYMYVSDEPLIAG